ncbi:MAG: hypothetical protein GY928_28355 [Colwellia sp.]|nr:hypothetical protein [Colwellia sp.]
MSENHQNQINDIKLEQKELSAELSVIKRDTSEIKSSLSSFDSKMTENISQVAKCLETLISLVEKDKNKEKRIDDLEETVKAQNKQLSELDKDQALSQQAAKNMESTAKEIKDTLKTGTWKLIGFTVGVIGLIVSIIVTVAVTLIK